MPVPNCDFAAPTTSLIQKEETTMKPNVPAVRLSLFFALLLATNSPGAELQPLRGHVPAATRGLTPIERVASTNRLNLAIALPLRNCDALTNLLRQITDPASPNYRHYLTPDQFARQFGPTEQDYQAVIAFAKANGFEVTATHPNRTMLDVSGTVAQVEQSLHLTMRVYRHPTEARTFYAPDTEPSLNLSVSVLGVSGLDNFALPQPHLQATPLTQTPPAQPNAGSGPSGTYLGNDFRAAYVPDSTLTGSGQTVGLLQFDGYTASDITYYEAKAGLPNVPLQNVLLDGFSGNPTGNGGEVEVSLDIEMAISMAPGLSNIVVYMAGPFGNWHDILNRMATDNLAKQLSCSWYSPGAGADPIADQIWQQMAAQGQSFYNASGDYDAFTGLIPFPGDTPYITQVGGTMLTTTGPGGAWVSERVWNRGNGIGSGGGISTQYPIPDWQTNLNLTAAQGSATMRNIPDVALTAEQVYVRADGRDYSVGGTSCAAPLWAGFGALVNQQAAASGRPAVGFINPLVDAIGSGATYATAFHDITTGDNTRSGSPTKFFAVPGYDLCTGWGTPAGQNLINALANPEPLLITPATGFASIGGVGGPFTVAAQSLSLTNSGTNSLGWSLVNTSLWLNATPGGGALNPGGPAAIVTVSLNTAASNLLVGNYSASIWFTNLSDGVGQSRTFSLAVIAPPAITSQPADQPVLDGATATFAVGAGGGQPLYYQWLRNGGALNDGGNISGSATSNLTVAAASAADAGSYSVIVSNAAALLASSNASLTITPSAPVITGQPATQMVGVGGTVRFTVEAVGSKPISYQWSFQGTNIDGATNTSLMLTNLQFSQAGRYTASLTNIYGSIQSSNAVLTVVPCDPLPSGIASWWKAEGNTTDSAGGNSGSPQGALDYAVGEVGQAFVFDGVTSYIAVPASPSLDIGTGSGIAIECWIQPASANTQGPLAEWDSTSTDGLQLWVQDGFQLYANIKDIAGTAHTLTSATGVLSSNVLQHVALTYDKASGLAAIYVNGSVVASNYFGSVTPQTTYPLNLGRRLGQPIGLGDTYGGLMDEVSIYNRALSPGEIAGIYIAGSAGKCFTPTPPIITTQPASQTNSVGSAAVFTVQATGTLPLGYQWSFNTTNLPGATNATLILANLQFSQAGNYAVLVSNVVATTLSSNAVLTVSPAPACDPPPPGLAAWWRAEGDASDAVNTNNGVAVGNLLYTNGEVGHAFVFDGSTSYIPLPASASLNLGINGGLTIECWIKPAAGTLAPIIEWDSATVDGLQFWCAGVLNANLIDTSGTAHVIQTAGSILDANNFQHVAVTYDKSSGNAVLYWNGTVVATSNFGNITPQTTYPVNIGRRTGQPIGLGDTYSGLMDELSLYNRALSAAEIQAIYNIGSGGKCTGPAPPTIITQPTNQKVTLGGTAVFSVLAGGTSPLNYQWRLNTTNIADATNQTLILTNVQYAQAGSYAVMVSNAVGSAFSTNAILTVNPPAPCDPPPSGLAAWWRAEGNANDGIGGNNGSPVGNLGYANGEVGQAFVFDGSTSYIPLPAAASLNLGAAGGLTIECWIKPNPGVLAPIIEWDSATVDGLQFWCAGVLNANIIDTSGAAHVIQTAGSILDPNNFQHVAVTYDKSSGSAVLYWNGTVVATNNFGNITPQTTYPVNIGRRTGQQIGLGDTYGGLMDELSLYSRALSASEIQAIYNIGGGGKCFAPTPPFIIAQPTNQIINAGGAASFTVLAGGTPPLSYQWNLNTTNIVGATNSALTLVNVQPANAGLYSLTVSNPYGTALSSNASLTVLVFPPVIIKQPTNLTVFAGGTANFSLVATGTLPLNYQWNFNGTNISGATNATLTLAGVQLSQAGNYSALVANAYGLTNSAAAVLTVNPAPPCDPTPANLLSWWPAEGNTHDLFGTNNGSAHGALNYASGEVGQAFLLDGSTSYISVPASPSLNIGTGSGLTIEGWIKPASANSQGPLLEWDSASTDGLQFWVQHGFQLYANIKDISGVSHTVASTTGVLNSNLLQHVALTYDKANGLAAIYVNSNMVVSNKIGSVTPQSSYPLNLGRRLGQAIGLGTTYSGLMDEFCIYNRALSSNEIAAIYLAGSFGKCPPTPPTVTVQPVSQLVMPGCSVLLSAAAVGTPPLSYQWWKDGSTVGGQTSNNLFIASVQSSNFGSYQLVVSNAYGSAASSNAVLALDHGPVANPDTLQRFATGGVKAQVADLLTNDTDADGDLLAIVGVSSNSAAGGSVYLRGNWVFYTPPPEFTNTDTYTYQVSDGHCGGIATGVVTVLVKTDNSPSGNFTIQRLANGTVLLTFNGIPGYRYRIQYSDSLASPNWQDLGTQTADGFGGYQFLDAPPQNAPARFYRSVWP